MPNIEVNAHFVKGLPSKAARELEEAIWERTKDMPFAGDIVVSQSCTFCRDRGGKLTPIIRIYSSHSEHFQPLIDALNDLAGIEIIKLERFVQKGQ